MTALSNNTWFSASGDDGIYIPRNEAESHSEIDIISWEITDDGIELIYYHQSSGREIFDKFNLDTLISWAIKERNLFIVYELPVYDPDNDEEYMMIYPPCSEIGTAEQINQGRVNRFLSKLNQQTLLQFLESMKKA